MSASNNLLWAHISEDDTKDLCATIGKGDVQRKLLQALQLHMHLSQEKQDVLGNHLFYAFAYAKDAKLSLGAIATYLSIIKEVFERDVDAGYKSMDDSFDEFKRLLLLHSVERSPHSIKVFEREDVPGLVENMTDTYYRHFRLYQCIFARQETLRLKQHTLFDIEHVPAIAPLAEGVLLRDENDYQGDDVDEDDEVVAAGADGDAAAGAADQELEETAAELDIPEDPEAGKAHFRAAKKTVQTLKSKIAEIRNYRVAPGKDAVRVLKATLYFLKYTRGQFHIGKKVSWDRMRLLLDEHFLSLLQNVDVTAVVKRPRYASLKRISSLVSGIEVTDMSVKSVAIAAILDWLIAAIDVKKASLPEPTPEGAGGGDEQSQQEAEAAPAQ